MSRWGRSGVGRRRVLTIAVVVTGALWSLPMGASAVGRQVRAAHQVRQDAAKPFFDSRVSSRHAAAARPAAASSAERSARAQLRTRLGRQADIQIDPLTGTARSIQRLDGALTRPAAGDRADVAMRWLEANHSALGLTSADVDALTLSDRTLNRYTGVTHLRYRQSYGGIPTFDGGVRVNLDRGGRLLTVTGSPVSGLRVASVAPQLDAVAALQALERNVGVSKPINVTSGPAGVRQVTHFAHGDFARLVLFDAPGGVRLAWHLTYQATSLAYYDAVVDAGTGTILFRQNLTKFDSAETVFPDYPGAEEADPPKDANNAPVTVNFEGLGWLTPNATTLTGPNTHVWSDVNDDNDPNTAPFDEEIRRADGSADFDDTFTEFPAPTGWTNACDFTNPTPGWPDPLATKARCAWDPTDRGSWNTNRDQNGVEAFYLANVFHDHLETGPIGFDETDGNFEGDDPVEVNADDGADTDATSATPGASGPDDDHINNANMSTPPDGQSPRMQMYLFQYNPEVDSGDPDAPFFTFRNINGGDDAATVWHEYTHGLSGRLVTHDDGSGALATAHAGAMGEAWSDWYALDLLHRPRTPGPLELDDPNTAGQVDIGMYSDAVFTATRFEPIDCPVNSTAPRCPGGIFTGHGGYTFGDFGKVAGAPEVHSDGEIWMQTLWDLRTRLIDITGDETDGSDLAEALVTEAMRLSPPEPSFLDMRNSILAAEVALVDDPDLHALIWEVFAGRGMGFYASAIDSSDVTPSEDFNVPPDPAAGTGTTAGTVTSADTGLRLSGVTVGFGGLTTTTKDPTLPFPEKLSATTAANGAYSLTAPAGRYGDLVFAAGGGYDIVDVPDWVVVSGATKRQDAALRRDWSASKGGAEVIKDDSKYDNTGADFGCGLDQLIDQSRGAGNSAFNPNSADPDNPHLGPPTALIHLPQSVDIEAFGLDPSNTCGDDPSAATKDYRIETSTDGVSFSVAKQGSFTPDDLARLNVVAPTANAQNVRWIRLTSLSPQDDSPGSSGADFIDFSEIEVFGGPKNVLPTGTLSASPATVAPGKPVAFTASFSDPDSLITGYDWDFNGDGTVDQSTTGPTTSHAYSSGGRFTAKVSAKDFRGGSGTASKSVHVVKAPKASLPKSGSHSHARFRVICDARCTASATLRVSTRLRRALGLKSRTVGSLKRTLHAAGSKRLTIKLTSKAKRALRNHGRSRVKVTLTLVIRYADGRHKTARRTITIRT